MRTEIYSVRSDAQEISYINNNIKSIANEINEKASIKILYKTEIDANAKKIKADLDESFIADNPPELYIFINALDTKDISSFYSLFSPFIEGLEKDIRKRYENRNISTDSYPHIQIHTIEDLEGEYPAYCFTFKRRKFLVLPRITLTGAELTYFVSTAIIKAKNIFTENFDKCPDGYIYCPEKPVSAMDKVSAFFSHNKQKPEKAPAEKAPKKQDTSNHTNSAPKEETVAESKKEEKAPAPKKETKQKKEKDKTPPAETPAKEIKDTKKPKKEEPEEKDTKKNSGFKNFVKSFIPMKGDSRKNLILKIVVLIAIVVFLVGAFLLLKFYVIDPKINDNDMKDIQAIFYSDPTGETLIEEITDAEGNVIETIVKEDKTPKPHNWEGVQKINKEIVGWVKLDKTQIDYPVLFHEGDNEKSQFYLYKNYKKKYSDFGSIFLDYRSKDADARHVMLHGHNMGSDKDAMFGSLIRYTIKDGRTQANTDYYKSHAIINYDTPNANGEWIVFAAMKLDVSNEKETLNYLLGEFRNDAQFMNFVYNLKELSYFDVNIPINETDRLLTLSTCSYETDTMRTIIVARQVREGEDVSKYIKGVKGKTPAYKVTSDFITEFDNIKWYDGNKKPEGDCSLENFEKKEMFTVKFYDANGKVIRTEKVLKGEDAVGIVGAKPAKKSDGKYNYRFIGWDTDFTNVKKNLNVRPKFEKSPIPSSDTNPLEVPVTRPGNNSTQEDTPIVTVPPVTTLPPTTTTPTTPPSSSDEA